MNKTLKTLPPYFTFERNENGVMEFTNSDREWNYRLPRIQAIEILEQYLNNKFKEPL